MTFGNLFNLFVPHLLQMLRKYQKEIYLSLLLKTSQGPNTRKCLEQWTEHNTQPALVTSIIIISLWVEFLQQWFQVNKISDAPLRYEGCLLELQTIQADQKEGAKRLFVVILPQASNYSRYWIHSVLLLSSFVAFYLSS